MNAAAGPVATPRSETPAAALLTPAAALFLARAVVAFDLDGTLVESAPHWAYELDDLDVLAGATPRAHVVAKAHLLAQNGVRVVVVTGRSPRVRTATRLVLERVGLAHVALYEREHDVFDLATAVAEKARHLRSCGAELYIGDRDDLDGAAARAAGIPVPRRRGGRAMTRIANSSEEGAFFDRPAKICGARGIEVRQGVQTALIVERTCGRPLGHPGEHQTRGLWPLRWSSQADPTCGEWYRVGGLTRASCVKDRGHADWHGRRGIRTEEAAT